MEESRSTKFADRLSTSTWEEVPRAGQKYSSEKLFCHGYDLLQLMEKRNFVDVLFLILRGELPSAAQKCLLNRLLVGFCTPGPRHPSSRAVMNAAASGTFNQHLLPIGLNLCSGEQHGAVETEKASRFIARNLKRDTKELALKLSEAHCAANPELGIEFSPAPGFGSLYGSTDLRAEKTLNVLRESEGAGSALEWASAFSDALHLHGGGILPCGVFAAASLDLGLHRRATGGLFQLASLPGLLSHAVEMGNKSIADIPFLDDQAYTQRPPSGAAR